MSDKLESLLKYVTENQRYCPMPMRWNELYKTLPNTKQVGVGRNPPPPLILTVWYDAPGLLKSLRLAEHIKWAAEHGALDTVDEFLRSLPEDQWFHGLDY